MTPKLKRLTRVRALVGCKVGCFDEKCYLWCFCLRFAFCACPDSYSVSGRCARIRKCGFEPPSDVIRSVALPTTQHLALVCLQHCCFVLVRRHMWDYVGDPSIRFTYLMGRGVL